MRHSASINQRVDFHNSLKTARPLFPFNVNSCDLGHFLWLLMIFKMSSLSKRIIPHWPYHATLQRYGVSHHWQLDCFCSMVCSGRQLWKHLSSSSLAPCEGNPPVTNGTQRDSNAENASIYIMLSSRISKYFKGFLSSAYNIYHAALVATSPYPRLPKLWKLDLVKIKSFSHCRLWQKSKFTAIAYLLISSKSSFQIVTLKWECCHFDEIFITGCM